MQLLLARPPFERLRRPRVRGEERLDRELGDRDVRGRAERRGRGDERKLVAVDENPQGDRDRARLEVRDVARLAAGIPGELLVQGEQRRVAADDRLAAEPGAAVRAPLAE